MDRVQQQYESLPYPPRAPAEEKNRLLAPILDCLDLLTHRAFGGRRDLRRGARVLVAGGGTGDSLIFLAEQFRETPVEIVYLDWSQAAMQVAQQRAEVRKLRNIQWHCKSLLDLSPATDGLFDYINCSGVLHHLESPADGLNSLCQVLAANGAIGLMLYGLHARAGVYQMQSLLRLVNHQDAAAAQRIANAKRLLNRLPEGNWFSRSQDLFGDHRLGDAGLYDLLLHERDQAFSVPQCHQLLEQCGLTLQAYAEPHLYRPEHYLRDAVLLEKIQSLTAAEQAATAELLCGNLKTHVFFARRENLVCPSLDDEQLIPSLPMTTNPSAYQQWAQRIAELDSPGTLSIRVDGKKLPIGIEPGLAPALRYFDGQNSIESIVRKASLRGKYSRLQVREALLSFCRQLEGLGLLFLRHQDLPSFQHVADLERRICP